MERMPRGRHARMSLPLVATLVVGAAGPLGYAPAASAVDPWDPIAGSGSTWVQDAVDEWRVSAAEQGLTVYYAGTGATQGRRDFVAGANDFAVSELPLQAQPADGSAPEVPPFDHAYLPLVAGGTSFMYHLVIDGERVTDLRLSGDVITKIFTGAITHWSDPAIQADNPQLTMPDTPIVPVVRADAAGPSAQLAQWMSTRYPQLWPHGATPLFPVPPNGTSQSGSHGVAGYVAQSYGEGSITYVENSYATAYGFPAAKVRNEAGYYVAPTADAVSIALLGAQTNAAGLAVLDGVYASPDPRAYPVSAYAYAIVPTEEAGYFTASSGTTLAAFLTHAICAGQADVEAIGYAPLPFTLVRHAGDVIRGIPGSGEAPAFDLAACQNPTFAPGDTVDDNALLRRAPLPPASDLFVPPEEPVTEAALTAEARTIRISATAGSSQLGVHAGPAAAGKTLQAGLLPGAPGGRPLGVVALDADGAGSVDIAGLGLAEGAELKLFLAESDGTVVGWNTFVVPPATDGGASGEVPTGIFELRGPAAGVVEFGAVRRGETASAALGPFTVVDDRAEPLGWELHVSIGDFVGRVDPSRTIPVSAVGIEPRTNAAPAGVALTGHAAGAAYPALLARAAPGTTTGADGVAFDALLSFVPPSTADAGEYRSTLTLTLTSP